MNILLCDDDHLIREIIVAMLHIGRHQVEVAYDGQDALEKIQAKSFDVLITDFILPRFSGIELIEKVRGMNIPLKVILITGFPDEVDRVALDRLQPNAYFIKPFNLIKLLDCVKTLGR